MRMPRISEMSKLVHEELNRSIIGAAMDVLEWKRVVRQKKLDSHAVNFHAKSVLSATSA